MNNTHNFFKRSGDLLDLCLDKIYDAILFVNKILLVAMVLVISYTVFGRFILNSTPSWGEEIGTFYMVWIAVLSSTLAVRNGRHIRMTIIEYFLPARAAGVLYKILHVFILLAGIVFIVNGAELTKLVAPSIMPATRISAGWLSLCLPVSGVLMVLMLIARFRRTPWS
jgi:TRAP-type C4-dicarboxylate transport system permease small subunit